MECIINQRCKLHSYDFMSNQFPELEYVVHEQFRAGEFEFYFLKLRISPEKSFQKQESISHQSEIETPKQNE